MLDRLKEELEEAAFMLVDNASRKDVHGKLVTCLMLVEQLRTAQSVTRQGAYTDEINKVKKRLHLWSKRQGQMNARILNAFLELQSEGQRNITEQDIYVHLGEPTRFAANFSQMKIIAERNHGKIFEIESGIVTIWPPVADAVDEYARKVFGKHYE